MNLKSIFYYVIAFILMWFFYSIYTTVTFEMFEGVEKSVISKKENSNYIAELYSIDRGAVGVAGNPILIIEEKSTGKIYEILSSEYISKTKWLDGDTLKVTLTENNYTQMDDFDNNRFIIKIIHLSTS